MAQLTFEKELESILNKYSKENGSNTPDFLLAEYLIGCMKNYDKTLKARDKWFDIDVWKGVTKLVDDTLALNKPVVICRFGIGDTVISVRDVFSETDYNKDGAKNIGKETYVVNKVEYWEQGEGHLVYGEQSDKRKCQVWHHEDDLELVSKNGI